MKKLKLNVELLRVQSFDTGPGTALGELRGMSSESECCSYPCGTIEALGDTDDCASKKADTMCEPPPSGQQACFAAESRNSDIYNCC